MNKVSANVKLHSQVRRVVRAHHVHSDFRRRSERDAAPQDCFHASHGSPLTLARDAPWHWRKPFGTPRTLTIDHSSEIIWRPVTSNPDFSLSENKQKRSKKSLFFKNGEPTARAGFESSAQLLKVFPEKFIQAPFAPQRAARTRSPHTAHG